MFFFKHIFFIWYIRDNHDIGRYKQRVTFVNHTLICIYNHQTDFEANFLYCHSFVRLIAKREFYRFTKVLISFLYIAIIPTSEFTAKTYPHSRYIANFDAAVNDSRNTMVISDCFCFHKMFLTVCDTSNVPVKFHVH